MQYLLCQPYVRWKALEIGVCYFGAVLIDEGSMGENDTFGLVFLSNRDRAGDGIADIDGTGKLE